MPFRKLRAAENSQIIVEYANSDRLLSMTASSSNPSQSQMSPVRGSGTFTIEFTFMTSVTQQEQSAFLYAADRLGKIITMNHPPIQIGNERCSAAANYALPSTINDLYILVNIHPIDGVGGILGQAGPCLIDSNDFPRVGYVEFDSADVQNMIQKNTFEAVCLHEISHVLGFGTLWSNYNLVSNSQTDPRYLGKDGIASLSVIDGEFMKLPAVQSTGGVGTALSHWRESVFGDELMTPYLEASYEPMSALTIDSLADLGYSVDSSTYDEYNVSSTGYNLPAPPPQMENPISPPQYFGNSGSTIYMGSTTIWVIIFIFAGLLILTFSFIYSYCKAHRRKRMSGQSININSTSPFRSGIELPIAAPVVNSERRADLPVATAVEILSGDRPTRKIELFKEFTGCSNVDVANHFLAQANGNVQTAVNTYLQASESNIAVI